ncbi:MAG: hypothetical protein MSS98_07955 [Alphaproteobacteria bacterium]|nr:hypothetical protein [Alphaproteobacteria bacterium]MDY4690430.1 hypothetical protein [Alphaproteobacteria bacterium]
MSISKNVILVIVEGISDEISLGSLQQYVNDNTMKFHICHGDITSSKRANPQNLITQINDIINETLKRYRYKIKDIKEIIHIVDTDGVFIEDKLIIQDENHSNFYYSEDNIKCKCTQDAINRNISKRQNLQKLISTHSIRNIPYMVYFMSCNLEHVLRGDQNLTDSQKEEKSNDFANLCDATPGYLLKIINKYAVSGDYQSSWKFIQQDSNSLKRYTNLPLFFQSKE